MMQYQVGDRVKFLTGLVTVYVVVGVAEDGTLFLEDINGLVKKTHPSVVKPCKEDDDEQR